MTATFTPFQSLSSAVLPQPTQLRAAITAAYRSDERETLMSLIANTNNQGQAEAQALARQWVEKVRTQRTRASGVDALMHEFSLSSEEGVALMCLAEALLRIPDKATADKLIADKISGGDWRSHLGESPSLFVNAATWGLLITGKLVSTSSERGLSAAIGKLITKGGEPLIRKGVDLAMRLLGKQFVTGQTIDEALQNGVPNEARGYQYSYDMLGEAALTSEDAAHYYKAYADAIHAIGKASNGRGIKNGPGISVKLSALHPRYSRAQRARVMNELLPSLKSLILLAKQYNIGFNIDAEETDRLELSLDLMEALAFDRDLDGFEGVGFVVQAYQKRCPFVLDYLIDLAHRANRKIMVRLVKGAYWDAEIKRAQVDGHDGYPVYTRKVYTDVSYLHCAAKLLGATDVIYAQFATHNAHTAATIYTWAQARGVSNYEFQCLHGMGETLYDQIVGADHLNKICRIYAPVGSHVTLLAYLVRRLLENGANSSFVNQIVDEKVSIDGLIADPFERAAQLNGKPHDAIALPRELYFDSTSTRVNAVGVDLSNEDTLRELAVQMSALSNQTWFAAPILAGTSKSDSDTNAARVEIRNPSDTRDRVGFVIEASLDDVTAALEASQSAVSNWQNTPPAVRADVLCRAADLFEQNRVELMHLAIREAGKSLPNAIAELREAVDFLRYYAAQVQHDSTTHALGAVVCIAPWNFPLAIFTGEVAASLAAGNVVLAKPAEQTPLIAHRAVQLLHEAGVPYGALQFLPGRGETVGDALVRDSRIKGVIFTGSTQVAHIIARRLAERSAVEGREIVLIAETGGQNALIVDSSALPEQVVIDVLASAFDSAGQRCSALRVLCMQADIADKVLYMLNGAISELRIGHPDDLAVDVGPVIDAEAQGHLTAHIERMRVAGHKVKSLPLPIECANGTFVAPTVIEINGLSDLTQEVFGPVLHVLRFKNRDLPKLLDDINATGFGLTLGVHTRIDETVNFVAQNAHVGNIYVNRNIVGAVVGVQPFGGEGKSGTGPKAGGPLYVRRLQDGATVTPATLGIKHCDTLTANSPLHDLLTWAEQQGHGGLVTRGHGFIRDALSGSAIELVGPTGERNTLRFAPRGAVLCEAKTVDELLLQLCAVWATGNTAVVLKAVHAMLPQGLPKTVRQAVAVLNDAQLLTARIDIALLDDGSANALRPSLISRSPDVGGLVQIVASNGGNIALWRLVAERALCINTTAAGGNASLMAMDA